MSSDETQDRFGTNRLNVDLLPNAIQLFMEMWGINFSDVDVWDYMNDFDQDFILDDTTIEEIRSLASNGVTLMR